MQQETTFQSLLKIRKHRPAQAKKHFIEARQALEKAQDALQDVNQRINHLQETMNATMEKHYGLGLLPLGQIIRSLQSACPGTFLNAKLEQRGDTLAYRVLLLRPSGKRVTMIVDARSGRVIGGRCR